VKGTITVRATGNNGTAVAECPGSHRVLSGGASGNGLDVSAPEPGTEGAATSSGWRAEDTGGAVTAYAICVAE
jgi:hypothetical protein